MVIRKIIGALLVSTSAAVLPAQAQFCSTSGTVTTLDFNVRPSLVVNSDAILNTTFNDAGLSGGDPTETLFSFKHTIGAILESAGAPNTVTSREAFVQTMLDYVQPYRHGGAQSEGRCVGAVRHPRRGSARSSTRRVC